jgi:hypothetical protein
MRIFTSRNSGDSDEWTSFIANGIALSSCFMMFKDILLNIEDL